MNTFIQNYEPEIKGTLAGWDRILIRGVIRTLYCVPGMAGYLNRIGCLLTPTSYFVAIVSKIGYNIDYNHANLREKR